MMRRWPWLNYRAAYETLCREFDEAVEKKYSELTAECDELKRQLTSAQEENTMLYQRIEELQVENKELERKFLLVTEVAGTLQTQVNQKKRTSRAKPPAQE